MNVVSFCLPQLSREYLTRVAAAVPCCGQALLASCDSQEGLHLPLQAPLTVTQR